MPKYPYVYWHEPSKRWIARIRLGGRAIHLGFFKTAELARDEVDRVVQELGLASSGKALCEIRKSPRKPGRCLERFVDEAQKVKPVEEEKGESRAAQIWVDEDEDEK